MSDRVNKNRAERAKSGKYPETERMRVLKKLQLNGFNYQQTERETGVSVPTLKNWRDMYPDVFGNQTTNRMLAIIENTAKDETVRIYKKSGNILSKALAQAEILIEMETDLTKVAGLIRALTPLATTLKEVDANNGYQKVSSLTATLEKLSTLNNKIVDVPFEESK